MRQNRSIEEATIRAVSYRRFGELPTVEQVPDPTPEPDGVVLRVAATGLCRSDWHGWVGHDPDITLPQIPGHEFAGTVVAVGREVRHFAAGDRVTAPFILACGTCAECAAGAHQVCPHQRQPGFTDPGSFAEFVAVPRADLNLVRVPDTLTMAAAATLGCRVGTAFHAVTAQAQVRAGEQVAVFGCGGLGLATVMIAAAAGAYVVAVDLSPAALALAATMGAVALRTPDELAGLAVHASFDCAGSPQAAAAAIDSLRPRGRHVQVGLLPESPILPMARVIAKELRIVGSHGIAAHEYPQLLALIERGAVDPHRLLGRTIGLEDTPAALAALGQAAPAGITVIEPGGVRE